MNKRVETILEAARSLTPEERGELLERLQHEMEEEADGTPEEIDAAWSVELKNRVREVENGEAELVPWEKVLAELTK